MIQMSKLFGGGLRKPTPEPIGPVHGNPRVRAVEIPPGVTFNENGVQETAPQPSGAAEVQDDAAAAVFQESPPNPAPAAVPVNDVIDDSIPMGSVNDSRLNAALAALTDGVPCCVAITYLAGDEWRHVVSTREFPHKEHETVIRQVGQQLREQREAER